MPHMLPNYQQQAAKNRGAVKPASSALSAFTPQIQEGVQNALKVASYPGMLFRRKSSGLRCTCNVGGTLQGSANPLDETSNGADRVPSLNDIEPGQTVLLPEPGEGTSLWHANQQGLGHNGVLPYGTRTLRVGNTDFGDDAHSGSLRYDNTVRRETNIDVRNVDLVEEVAFDPEAILNDPDGTIQQEQILGTATNTLGCGVCVGTGFVGGFDPLNGWRLVLAAGTSATLASVNTDTVPYSYDPGTVEWSGIVPLGTGVLLVARVWNNKERADGEVTISHTENGVTTQYAIHENFPRGVPVKITVVAQTSFTHLEMMWGLDSEPFLVDFPRLSETQNLQLKTQYDPISATCSPVPMLRVGDVFAENVYNELWLVTNVQHMNTRERRPLGWDFSARVVQPYEILSMLPIIRKGFERSSMPPRQNVRTK